ncbi:fungal-specific transcription factor domain-containing protein [Immersiella caudata]|uniref:Fungal-specific transcription factor domain-containing protein n=1 Tax=Immersiella caudata TaxID=314043 RepID=A0AA40BUX0_9PEZI|nr:fungal-specific transcription factor domain-containing protein [Immersiella caudata]
MSAQPNQGRHKPVCNACRARKKKCDGEQPTCSSCAKRKVKCSYINIPPAMLASFPWTTTDLNPFSLPMATNLEALAAPHALFQPFEATTAIPPLTTTDPWDSLLFESPDLLPPSPPNSDRPRSEQGAPLLRTESIAQDWIPPQDKTAELVDLFFERVQWYFPLFHRQSLVSAVKSGELMRESPLLLYSILSLAARFHPDSSIRDCRLNFYDKSRALYETTPHLPERPLETLQAAACISLQAFMLGDHSIASLTVGKAWRQAVALGFHHLDTPSRVVLPGITAPDANEWREQEQRRRVLWTLFILDKAMCFKAGLVHIIDSRQISVFLPMDENAFQTSHAPPDTPKRVPYPHNPTMLISTLKTLVDQKQGNMMQLIILTHSLMSRISEHMFSPVFGQDDPEHKLEKDQLDQDLTQMRLLLPRYATDLAVANHADFRHVIWLRLTMDMNTVSLHHRAEYLQMAADDGVNDEQETRAGSREGDRWQHCVVAARNTVALIRETSRVSTDLMMNPFLAASIFSSARILAIEYTLSSPDSEGANTDQQLQQRQALRADLEVMNLIFERLCEAFGGVFEKFRIGLLYQLRLDATAVRAVKAGGTRGLLESCGKWPALRNMDGLEGIPD